MNKWKPTKAERQAARGMAWRAVKRGHVPWSVDVQDLEQAAVIALWETREVRALHPNVDASFFARRGVYDQLRRETGRPWRPAAENFDAETHGGVDDATPEKQLQDKQRLGAVDRRLTDTERATLAACFNCDTRQDAAAQLGIEPATLAQRLAVIRRKLAAVMG